MKYDTAMKAVSTLALVLISISAFAQHGAGANSPEAAKKARADLAAAKAKYTKTKAAFKASPKNAAAKKAYVDATVNYATTTMMSGVLTPKEKYPTALALYREALKTDPNNKEAKNNAKMIEDIYRSMGRPIPK